MALGIIKMRVLFKIIIIQVLLLLLNGCITQFVPGTNENKKLLVVEGLLTNKPGPNIIKLSESLPLGTRYIPTPVTGSIVTLSDNDGNTFNLSETDPGSYSTDYSSFQGKIGQIYTLHITLADNSHKYQSVPVEMKPVPPIDSIYYEKVAIVPPSLHSAGGEGCQIFLNTHDPNNLCKYYRWEFVETWNFVIPYPVPNKVCWTSNNSGLINIKNITGLAENRIERYPLNYISNETDKLKMTYSILVNQYSLNEEEYNYWEILQKLTEQTGGLYDMIPSSVSSNVYCIDDANQNVQGYFSVSAASSKRIFIKDQFAGQADPYSADKCVADTIFGGGLPAGLNISSWIIVTHFVPPYVVFTYFKGCYDCTVRGTNIRPDFWIDGK